MSKKIMAAAQFPELSLHTVNGGLVVLGQPDPQYTWKMIVVYRGRHCPLCTRYLLQLENLKQAFYDIGIDVIAVSGDSLEQAQEHLSRMTVNFPIAYGLSVEQMQQLGLYISNPRSEQETDHPFAEPGLFVINEQGQVQVVDISNSPFTRPELSALLSGLGFIRDPANSYPIRSTYQ